MKKSFLSAFCLVLALSQLPVFGQKGKFKLTVGGTYNISQAGYDFRYSTPYSEEVLTVYDSMRKENQFGPSLGLGYFVTDNLELTASVSTSKKSLSGTAALDLPNAYYYNDIAYAGFSDDRNFSRTAVNFGMNFYFGSPKGVRPYIGAGASYISALADLMRDLTYLDLYEHYYVWGVWIGAKRLGLAINSVDLEETDVRKLGFYGLGGIDFRMNRSMSFFMEARYTINKARVRHPLGDSVDEDLGTDLDLGGLDMGLGLSFRF